MAEKLKRSLSGCREVEPNLFVVNPLVLPLPGHPFADRLNAYLLVTFLRRLCHRLGLDRPILWTFLPNVNQLVGKLGEQMVIYHCVDKYSAFSGVPREALIRIEKDLVRRAQLVFASSEQLAAELKPLNPNTYFISHGVDVSHFARALDPSTAVPHDLRGLPRPVIGYFGLLADWLDLPLMRALAIERPSWSFVLVGKAVTDVGMLQGLPNIHMLGQKPYTALPAYCRGFDLGVIPFRMNELTVRANPLKLREYLAAGLPVVSTPLPEVMRYKDLVHVGDGLEAFISGIEAALRERDEEMVRRRVEAMRAEGWEARVEEISALISSHSGVLV
jgi:glycosyltransferase involved in cell wall biosynthesis